VLRVIIANAATGGEVYPTEDRPIVLVHESGGPHLVITPTETWCGRHGKFTRRFPTARQIVREYLWMPVDEDGTFGGRDALERLRAMRRKASASQRERKSGQLGWR
jgi:hypothetical protein